MSDKYPGGFVTAGAPTSYSVYVDGSGDYLTVANNPAMNTDTVCSAEIWLYPTLSSADQAIMSGNGNWDFLLNNGNVVMRWFYPGYVDTGVTALTLFTWNHIAFSISGGRLSFYVNGTRVYTNASVSITNVGSVPTYIGWNGGNSVFKGYLSNARITKGYTPYDPTATTINVPTQLFNVTGTGLLTCQNPTIRDNSSNAFTVNVFGDAKASNFSPFPAYTGFNPALGAAAGGVWTLDEASYYQNSRTWPIYDPYFNKTTLMIHGSGTNGAANNTFLDSSTNNFTITRNGNTTQGSFSPFSQTGWSNNFVGGYFAVPYSAGLMAERGDFTWETWVYPTSGGGNHFLFSQGSGSLDIYRAGSNKLTIDQAGIVNLLTSTADVPLNTWTHYAVTRQGTTTRLFVNGALDASGTSTANLTNSNTTTIGSSWPGYISNTRFVKGTAIYISGFTPPTAPLTNIYNTSLLTCQSNSFVDNSPVNGTVSFTSTPTVQAFSPFVPSYVTPTTYSNTFDGSGDYLTFPDTSTSCAFPPGTDFTIECWMFNKATTSQGTLWSTSSGINASESLRIWFGDSTNTLVVWSTFTVKITSSATFLNNTWYHVAVVRSGTTLTLYQNGINVGSASNNQSFTSDNFTIANTGGSGGPYPMNGVVSNLRVVKGTALYTANFTPPTSPLTAISGTQILTCQSSTFKDNSTNNYTVTPSGDAKIIRGVPFSSSSVVVDQTSLNSTYTPALIGGSYYGNAVGDYLSFTDPSNVLDLGGIVASFECWYYPTTLGAFQNIFFKYGSITWSGSSAIEYAIAMNNGAFVITYNNGGSPTALTDPTTRVANQWYHVAVATDTSNNISLYVNGVRVANATNAITKPTTRTNMYVGSVPAANEYVRGYISGLRFITGSNAYNAASLNIGVPPLTPPTAVSGTQFLTNFTNGAIFDEAAKCVVQTVGDAQLSTSIVKYGGSSIRFDGTGDRLQIVPNTSRDVVLGTGDFTIELWVYFTSLPAGDLLLVGGDTNAAYLIANSSGQIRFGTYNVNWLIGPAGTMTTGTWYHVAVTRSGTTINLFLNGVAVATPVSSAQDFSAASYVIGGDQVGGSTALNGYMDDIRITKACRYFGNFTPPTSAMQNQ
jgi:hypothetical protein